MKRTYAWEWEDSTVDSFYHHVRFWNPLIQEDDVLCSTNTARLAVSLMHSREFSSPTVFARPQPACGLHRHRRKWSSEGNLALTESIEKLYGREEAVEAEHKVCPPASLW